MSNQFQSMFPMIRKKNDILNEIRGNVQLNKAFNKWNSKFQETFLNFCSGATGNRILYDAFFKEVMNPEYTPERVEELLSLLLGRHVKIKEVLPADSTRMADETSLLIMDIVVELDDGTIANVEIQKFGYAFPGQRSACYSSDLLLRQYKRVKSKKRDNDETFSYRDICRVYTIILFEKSPQEFKAFPNDWLHRSKQVVNTGLKLDLLQEYVFIPLDIFQARMQNKLISSKLEAWLSFFSMSKPEDILSLIRQYPEFKQLYAEIYTICQNTERVMGMFSEELRLLDRNTARYMMDEMQDELDEMQGELNEMQDKLDAAKGTIKEQQGTIEEQQDTITNLKKEMSEALIHTFIKTCKQFTKEESIIIEQLQKEFSIDGEEAEKLLNEFEA